MIGAAGVTIGLWLFPGLAARSTWGSWTGLIGLILILAIPAQALAPEAAFLFVWTGLLAAVAAALAALLDPSLTRTQSLAPAAFAAVLGGGWIMAQAHGVFLGVGMDLPGVLVLLGLLVLMLIRPFGPEQGLARPLLIAAAAALLIGGGLSVAGQVMEPMVAAKTACPRRVRAGAAARTDRFRSPRGPPARRKGPQGHSRRRGEAMAHRLTG